jgi:hypothetical protein
MAAHEAFEQLCALSVTGETSAEEFRRLQEHLHECPSCRACYRDYHALLGEGLPALAQPPLGDWKASRFGLKKRFLERTRREGIPITSSRRLMLQPRWAPAAATAVGLLLLMWPSYRVYVQRSEDDERTALLFQRIAELERVVSAKDRPAAVPFSPPPAQPAHPSGRERELANQLAALRAEYDLALAEKAQLREEASHLSAQLDGARDESRTAKAEAENLARTLQQTRGSLARANQDLDSVRSTRSWDEATIAEQRIRFDQLAAKVREQSDILDRERELLTAAKDIRDLMGARNMQVAEVADVGGPRRREIPGRVSYSRERLIYYAFDLENRGDVRKVPHPGMGKARRPFSAAEKSRISPPGRCGGKPLDSSQRRFDSARTNRPRVCHRRASGRQPAADFSTDTVRQPSAAVTQLLIRGCILVWTRRETMRTFGLAVALALALYAGPTATLTGRVTDMTGAVMQGVEVQAINIETGVKISIETNDEGLYRIPQLPPGTYRIVLQKHGFSSIVKPGVKGGVKVDHQGGAKGDHLRQS